MKPWRIPIIAAVTAVSLFWGVFAYPQPSELPEPVYLVAWTLPPTDPVPAPVDHEKPAEIVYAMSYLEMQGHYLEVGERINPDALELALENRPNKVFLPVLAAVASHPEPVGFIKQYVEQFFFPAHHAWAYRVSWCESRWNPNAENKYSTATGIFQFLRDTWTWVALDLGLPSFDDGGPYNPEWNIQAAAYLFYHPHGGPGRWVCK